MKQIIIPIILTTALLLLLSSHATAMNTSILSAIASIFKKKDKERVRIENTVNGHADKLTLRPGVQVTIPETSLTIAETNIDGLPHVCVLNTGIYGFEHKEVFRWFLVLGLNFEKLARQGIPQSGDVVGMQDFFDILNEKLVNDPGHPNALLLGRVTGNGVSQFMWYVNNPELANSYLQGLIESKTYPFDFQFEMYQDPEWKEAGYWLTPLMEPDGH